MNTRIRRWSLATLIGTAVVMPALARLDWVDAKQIKLHFAMIFAPGFACYLLLRKVIVPLAVDARTEFRFGRPGRYGPTEFVSEVIFWAAASFLGFFPIALVFVFVGACLTAALGIGGVRAR